jgi:hypothetical protein
LLNVSGLKRKRPKGAAGDHVKVILHVPRLDMMNDPCHNRPLTLVFDLKIDLEGFVFFHDELTLDESSFYLVGRS